MKGGLFKKKKQTNSSDEKKHFNGNADIYHNIYEENILTFDYNDELHNEQQFVSKKENNLVIL